MAKLRINIGQNAKRVEAFLCVDIVLLTVNCVDFIGNLGNVNKTSFYCHKKAGK